MNTPKRAQKQKFFPRSLMAFAIALFSIAAAPPASYIQLTTSLNARANDQNFRRDYPDNFLFTLDPQTIGKILAVKTDLKSGNLAYQVQITQSPGQRHLNKTVWIYDDVLKNPGRLALCLDANCRQQTTDRQQANAAKAVETKQPTPALDHPPLPPSKPVAPSLPAPAPMAKASPSKAPSQKNSQPTSQLAAASVEECNGNCTEPSPTQVAQQTLTEAFTQVYANNPVVGARKVMAAMYQSCDVLDKPPYDWSTKIPPSAYHGFATNIGSGVHSQVGIRRGQLQTVIQNHYYLKDLHPGPNCRDMRESPPLYYFGGKPNQSKMSQDHTLDLFTPRTNSDKYETSVGLDCSAFISSAFAATGRKLSTSSGSALYMSSRDFLSTGTGRANECFERPDFTKQQTIQSGDVLSFGSHVVMIDQVTNSQDPFGLENRHAPGVALQKTDCFKQVKPKDLGFTLIQSTGTSEPGNSNIGIARTVAARFFSPANASKLQAISDMAQIACLARFTASGTAKLPKAQTRWSLLRHLGDSKPACMSPKGPMEFEGGKCIENCFADYLKRGI